MSKKFYGIIETSTTRKESYETKVKGKTVTKTRNVSTPKSVAVTSSQEELLHARKELADFAKQCGGELTFVGAYK